MTKILLRSSLCGDLSVLSCCKEISDDGCHLKFVPTGLDPAGLLWDSSSSRLSPTDGVYVEAIHTDGGNSEGAYGSSSAVAQVDFHPNGGSSQPGCFTNLCSHNRAWEIFAATITYNHLTGYRCDNDLQITWNSCRGIPLSVGNDDLRKTG